MSMTWRRWEDEIKTLDTDNIEAIAKAVETLMAWPKFKEHFGWTGVDILDIISKAELRRRKDDVPTKSFRVTLEIDITATSPVDAARQALEIQRDAGSRATVFSVDGMLVDLEDNPEEYEFEDRKA